MLMPETLDVATRHTTDCGDFSSIAAGDTCRGTWSELRHMLRPTQRAVGYAWVFHTFLEKMQSEQDAQHAMDDKIVPVSLGSDSSAYVLDHHHHLAALDLSGFEHVQVSLTVACDLSYLPRSVQLSALANRSFAYLYGRPEGQPDVLPTAIDPSALPATIAFRTSAVTMEDDRWRALSSFSVKVENGPVHCNRSKYCGRAYVRVCNELGRGIPFFEYRWAYLYNEALTNTTLWPSATEAATFSEQYAALSSPTPASPTTNFSSWFAAAASLVYVARGDPAGQYRLPSSVGNMAGKLPGYVHGLVSIDDGDPDCAPPTCVTRGG